MIANPSRKKNYAEVTFQHFSHRTTSFPPNGCNFSLDNVSDNLTV